MKKVVILVIVLIAFLSLGITTAPSNRIHEKPIDVEEWMTMPFVDSIEEPLEVEEWMTRPFNFNS